MNSIVVKSPTRVDLAGGTLDLWPLFLFIGGAVTVNVAIDIYTTAEITPLPDGKIELVSEDLKISKSYSGLEECLRDNDPKLHLLQVQMKYWKPQKGFRLRTQSMSPVGGGLGGSSSLTISLLKAFNIFCGGDRLDAHQMVRVAHNVEAEVLNTPTGTQDYYPAFKGGINILTYTYNGISQEVLDAQTSELEKHFLLVYTGKAHHSGLNNFEVMKRAIAKDPQVMKALADLRDVAKETAEACRKAQWQLLPGLFKREYQSRVLLAKEFSSPEIEKLAEVSLQAGADAVKICGAGGGGCVLVWVQPSHRERVSVACQNAGFQVLAAKPVKPLVGRQSI